MKKSITIFAALLCLCLVCIYAADDPCTQKTVSAESDIELPFLKDLPPCTKQKIAEFQSFKKELNITEDQKKEIRLILKPHLADISQTRDTLHSQAETLRNTILNNPEDEKALNKGVSGLSEAITGAGLLASDIIDEIRTGNVLTDKQTALIQARRITGEEHMDKRISEIGASESSLLKRLARIRNMRNRIFGSSEDLDLNPGQKVQIIHLIMGRSWKIQASAAQSAASFRTFRDQVCASDPDKESIKQAASNLADSLAQSGLVCASLRNDIHNLLTPAQIHLISQKRKMVKQQIEVIRNALFDLFRIRVQSETE